LINHNGSIFGLQEQADKALLFFNAKAMGSAALYFDTEPM
jgi:hypothetical protein